MSPHSVPNHDVASTGTTSSRKPRLLRNGTALPRVPLRQLTRKSFVKKVRAFAALLDGASVTKAAELVSVSRQTIHRWLNDEAECPIDLPALQHQRDDAPAEAP